MWWGTEEDSGNEVGEGKDDNNDLKGIGDQYSVIRGSNVRGEGY